MNIFEEVKRDFIRREVKGIQTYGDTLKTDSSVDMLIFAYEEALDKVLYLRAEINRREIIKRGLSALKERTEKEIYSHSFGDRPSSPSRSMLDADIILAEALDLLEGKVKLTEVTLMGELE